MKHFVQICSVVCGVALLLGCTVSPFNQTKSLSELAKTLQQLPDRQMITAKLNEQDVQLEVVNSPASITLGLSGRSAIGSDGMLFVSPTNDVQTFWMKDMRFPIDLVWIQGGRVIGVTAQVQAPQQGQRDDQLLLYKSPGPADLVLELPAGIAAQRQIKVGDVLIYTGPINNL